MTEKISYSLKELCRSLDVTERTVRYYISEGLLPPPTGNTPFNSRYGYEHWLRLHFIRRLKEEYLPLSEIKNLLAGHSLAELESLARRTGLLGEATSSEGENTPQDSRDAYLESLLRPGKSELLRKQIASSAPAEPEAENDAAVFGEADEITGGGATSPFPLMPEQGFGPPPAPSAWQPINLPSAPMASFGAAPQPSPTPPPPSPGMFPPSGMRAMGGMPKPGGFSPSQFNQSLSGQTRFSMSPQQPSFNQPPPGSQPPPEQEEPVSQNWERIVIAPGVELHVESSIANRNRPALSLLLREIRRLLGK